MAQTAIWVAPSLDALSHSNIRLDCTPETLRAIWRASTSADVMVALVDHFGGAKWGTVAEEQADDAFHSTRMDGQALLPLWSHKRELVNLLAGFHGVEYLGTHKRSGKGVRYCDAGETYAPTLFFCGRRLFVGTLGDVVESGRVRHWSDQ